MSAFRLVGKSFNFLPQTVSFSDKLKVKINSLQVSETVAIEGLSDDVFVPITIADGEFSINGSGNFTSGAKTIFICY